MTVIKPRSGLRVLALYSIALLLAGANSMTEARWGGGYHEGGGFHHGMRGFYGDGFREHVWVRGFDHFHRWGGFYIGTDWFWGPTVIVAGVPYYYYDGWYYTPVGDCLVVFRCSSAKAARWDGDDSEDGRFLPFHF